MKLSHALVIAADLVVAGLLIAGSNLLYDRSAYIYTPNTDALFRVGCGSE